MLNFMERNREIEMVKITECRCGRKYSEPRYLHKGCCQYSCSDCYQWKTCEECLGKKKSLLDNCTNKECIKGKVLVGFKVEVIEKMKEFNNFK